MVAVTVKLVAPASSFTLFGATLSRMSMSSLGERIMPSSSSMVVVISEVPSVGVCPPPPAGLEMEKVKVSLFSATIPSMVCTSTVCDPAAVFVKVNVPDLVV